MDKKRDRSEEHKRRVEERGQDKREIGPAAVRAAVICQHKKIADSAPAKAA